MKNFEKKKQQKSWFSNRKTGRVDEKLRHSQENRQSWQVYRYAIDWVQEPMSGSIHTKLMSRHFYRLIYFYCTFSFVTERQFRSSDAVTSISFLWLVMAFPWESHSRKIRSKNKSVYENVVTGMLCSCTHLLIYRLLLIVIVAIFSYFFLRAIFLWLQYVLIRNTENQLQCHGSSRMKLNKWWKEMASREFWITVENREGKIRFVSK